MPRSNCLIAAAVVALRTRGRVRWWPGWSEGWSRLHENPWGHFYAETPDGTTFHFHAHNRNLHALRQLWFSGKLVQGGTWKCDHCGAEGPHRDPFQTNYPSTWLRVDCGEGADRMRKFLCGKCAAEFREWATAAG